MNAKILGLCLFLLIFLSLSQPVADRLRILPSKWIRSSKMGSDKEISSLQLENYQLRSQLDLVYEWLSAEKNRKEFQEISELQVEELKKGLQKQAITAFARIIYRDPASWSSSCWIDVGEENNASFGRPVIAKNSSVVQGSSLIGVIEYVGKRQSRVRLITDSGVKIGVRAIRGSPLDREIASLARILGERLKKHPQRKEDPLLEHLHHFEQNFPVRWEDGYFAKGEISGSSAPYFRSLKSSLKGTGFNCDFPDSKGPARDLRTLLLQEGDLLVTSGLDGIFPAGLKVGLITKVEPLSPGAFFYDLEAEASAIDLADLKSVHVLAPVSSD